MNTHDIDIELPEPAGHYYEWDGAYGKRKFTTAPHNGRECDRAVAYYTEDQVRAAIEADRKRRYEEAEVDTPTPEDMLSYAMYIAHERELRIGGHKHDEPNAIERFNAAVQRLIDGHSQRRGEPVAFAQDGNLFWHGDHRAWREFSGELYLTPQPAEPAFRTPDCPECGCVQDGQCLCSPSSQPAEPVTTDSAGYTLGPISDGGMDPRDRTTLNDPIETSIRRFELLAADRNHGAVDPLVGAQELRAYKDSLAPQPAEPAQPTVPIGYITPSAVDLLREGRFVSLCPTDVDGGLPVYLAPSAATRRGAQNASDAPQPTEPLQHDSLEGAGDGGPHESRMLQQRAIEAEPVAWLDPETGDVIAHQRKRSWEADYGVGGRRKAEPYTIALTHAAPNDASALREMVADHDDDTPDAARWQKARTLPRSWWRDAFNRIAAEGVTLDELIDAEMRRKLP